MKSKVKKVQLPDITVVCIDCIDANRAAMALEFSQRYCEFADSKLFTCIDTPYPHIQIPDVGNLSGYSEFMFFELHKHIETSHMLVVQHDGFVINAGSWNKDWMKYDYMGPLWIHDHIASDDSVGSGGFSLRSKKIMERVSQIVEKKRPFHMGEIGWAHEDGVIAHTLKGHLQSEGFVFGPASEAIKFAQGGYCNPAYYVERPFGFHGLWPNIAIIGIVGSWPDHH